jgi:hypothetical protein
MTKALALIASAGEPATLSDAQLASTLEAVVTEGEQRHRTPGEPTRAELAERTALVAAAMALSEERKRRSAGGSRSPGVGPAAMAAVAGRARPSPTSPPADRAGRRVTVHAVTGMRGIQAGTPLTSSAQLTQLTAEALRAIANAGGADSGRRVLVATASTEYPPERQLTGDAVQDSAKLDSICGLHTPRYDRQTGALVASGGVCLPVNVDYSVPTWATADRPLREGLPGFQASRGGLRFVTPPDVGVPSLQGTPSGLASATTVWAEATDANPAGATKPVYAVQCGTEELVYVNAVPTRVQFGNMQSRFAPEQVAANTQLAIAAAAREAELELLTTIANATKQVVPGGAYLGAARDILGTLDLVRAQYLYNHRMPRTAALTAVFPDWARDVIRADLAREVAHDNSGSFNVLQITDEQIDDLFAARNVNVIWTIDALKAGTYGTGGSSIPAQFFPLATAGAQPIWPSQSTGTNPGAFTLAWFLFVEGTFQYLDGGQLDLGVVRDSSLDSTNDYETFVEVFETVAFRGIEALQVQQPLKVSGGSAGTVGVTSYVE